MKKSVFLFLFICIAVGSSLFSQTVIFTYANDTITPEKVLIGDVNADGNVDSLDFAYIRKYLLGKIIEFPEGEKGLAAADIDGSGYVDSLDFAYMRKYLLGKGTFPPISTPSSTSIPTPTPTPISTPHIITELGFDFNLSTGTIIKYIGTSRYVIIPSMISAVEVKAIGTEAFSNRPDIFSVTIPQGVTTVGFRAFADCSALRSVKLPEGLTSIADLAFSGCSSLTSITLPESLTNISWSAFADCSELKEALFLGNQPEALGGFIFANADTEFKIKVSQNAVGFGKPTPYNDKTSWEWSIDFNPIYNVVISEIPTDEVIAFRDEYLKSIVSEAIGKSDDDVIYKSDLDKITFLSLVPPEVIKEPIDLSELAMLTNLERLYVREFSLGDMTPFAHLTNLTELKISYCSIDDLRPLKNLTKLISLEMHFTGISDISVLKGLTNLEHLNLANNNISDISALKNLTKLTFLDLSNNHISDISSLENLNNLQYLNLMGNNLIDE